jgi:hypothetical protein
MSLRTDFTGATDTALAAARAAGVTFIDTTNLAAITSAMAAAAAQGKRAFTLSYSVTYQTEDLKLLGPLWEAFETGITQALAVEDIMGNEVTVSLNTSDTVTTRVDLAFDFCG